MRAYKERKASNLHIESYDLIFTQLLTYNLTRETIQIKGGIGLGGTTATDHDVSRPTTQGDGAIGISVRSTADGATVIVRGELDIESAAHLGTALLQAAEACADGGAFTLDLSQVTFCDSTGLNVLLRARRRALSEHRSLTITAASPQMARLLEITGAAPLFAGEV